jgi:hypothetical protein
MKNDKMPELPASTKIGPVVLRQAEVSVPLWEAANIERKKLKITNKQLFEWCLRAFILKCNPARAASMGIKHE